MLIIVGSESNALAGTVASLERLSTRRTPSPCSTVRHWERVSQFFFFDVLQSVSGVLAGRFAETYANALPVQINHPIWSATLCSVTVRRIHAFHRNFSPVDVRAPKSAESVALFTSLRLIVHESGPTPKPPARGFHHGCYWQKKSSQSIFSARNQVQNYGRYFTADSKAGTAIDADQRIH